MIELNPSDTSRRKCRGRRGPRPIIGLGSLFAALATAGCISTESDILDATEGCDEYAEGTVQELDIDPDAKRFIEASREVSDAIGRTSDDVLTACANIARDLGEDDTWSERELLRDRISNDDDDGACDAALLAIDRQLNEASRADVDLQVAIASGECRVDFDTQAACDQECAAGTTCEPGSIEARCEPGSITALCDGSCAAGAFCVGSADLAANCMGRCESTCVGACEGTCYGEDGQISENDPNCRGKCAAACNGKCFGQCKVEAQAGIACGAGVYCRGSCDGVMESPACITTFDPPQCDVDTACYEACTARLATDHAECTPTSVTVLANVEAMPELEPVAATLDANLPVLVEAAKSEGRLLQDAGHRMARAGHELDGRIDDLDGKSLACVGVASTALADAVDSISVSVEASLELQSELEVNVETTDVPNDEATAGTGG